MKAQLRFLLLLAIVLVYTACSNLEELVASTHPNGKPEAVLYMKGKGTEQEKVMEKVYYPSGQLEYIGRFANGVEHGVWSYYYEDGTIKFKQQWKNGLEDGVHYDYARDGQVYREIHYKEGRKIKEIDRSKD